MTPQRIMKTCRMVVDTPRGAVTIDVALRGYPAGVAHVEPIIKAFLDFDCGLAGAWVDRGTERNLYSIRAQSLLGCERRITT